MSEIKPFPLMWPLGYPRTEEPRRSLFFALTIAKARDGILEELRKWKADNVVISSNAPLMKNGQPYSTKTIGHQEDTGVAVYFNRAGEQWVVPCDEYDTIWDNMQAIRYIIESLRTIERHGGAQAFRSATTNFKALPERGTGLTGWEILKIKPCATEAEIKKAYRDQLKTAQGALGNITSEKLDLLVRAKEECLAAINRS
ncbi:hypothetical protein AHMF7605_10355 [Adhaeribacter arboris]|uniref:J domain-containing protein n=1 Tax=Adhaeribacter arboris TaxID=2072846 RepID=A0A2T2YEF3_9BACT|nr:J domain-containing protein [Adhaeribacter arboris]PSR53889.1 hypothetical protein AHMF7605_10355 [Adhaeribacter arboris]